MKVFNGFIILLFILSCIGCSRIKKTDAEIEREQWIAGFSDSIEFYQNKKQEVENELDNLNTGISAMLGNFERVKNPREVSGYYILKGWNNKLPFTSTGIYARINENEKLELIATLAGSTFNRLGVGSGSDVFFSEVVPHDQAFNYRHERYNTVYFSGGKADTVAQYIAKHRSDKINLDFLEGKKKTSFTIPSNEKDMIADTWNLLSSQIEAKKLQKELWICSRKIDTFRRIMEMQNQKENQQENQKDNQ